MGQKRLKLNLSTIARMGLYILSPCLAFSSLTNSRLTGGDTFGLMAVMLSTTAALWLLGSLTCRFLQQDVYQTSAFLLATLFTNAGNYGVPLLDLAFGRESRDLAVVGMVTQQILFNTLAFWLATRGKFGWRQGLRKVLLMPVMVAVLAAVFFLVSGLPVPGPIDKGVSLLGNAALPVILLSLGIQLAETAPVIKDAPRIGLAVIFRLVLSPALALVALWLLAPAFDMSGLAAKVAVVVMAMPSAVSVVLMAIEFGADAKLVSAAAFFSTLASIVSLTAILTLLI